MIGEGREPLESIFQMQSSSAGGSVDEFAEDVGVPGVAAGFFDHVRERPACAGARPVMVCVRGGPREVRAVIHGGIGLLYCRAVACHHVLARIRLRASEGRRPVGRPGSQEDCFLDRGEVVEQTQDVRSGGDLSGSHLRFGCGLHLGRGRFSQVVQESVEYFGFTVSGLRWEVCRGVVCAVRG